jgi:hypothetical protein
MATKEVKEHVKIALAEIGKIQPWFDKRFNAWVFSSDLYPVECEGKSAKEVIKKFPKYLEVFLEHRLQGNLDQINENKTKGKGGARPNAGRPVGTKKEPTKQIRIPFDLAVWLKQPGVIPNLQNLMQAYKHA